MFYFYFIVYLISKQDKYQQVAGRVTGMLLEMNNTDILHLLENRELLASRIDEAAAVLAKNLAKRIEDHAQPNHD